MYQNHDGGADFITGTTGSLTANTIGLCYFQLQSNGNFTGNYINGTANAVTDTTNSTTSANISLFNTDSTSTYYSVFVSTYPTGGTFPTATFGSATPISSYTGLLNYFA